MTLNAWNTADKTSGMTLSDDDTVATTTSGSDDAVRGLVGHSSGLRYFEFIDIVSGGLRDYWGLATAAQNLSSDTGHRIGFQDNGAAIDGGGGGSGFGDPTGHTVGFAVDLDTQHFWFTYDGSAWYGYNPFVGTTTPVGNLNGVPFVQITAGEEVFPWCRLLKWFVGPTTTLVVDEDNFTYSLPSGYSAWGDTGGGGTPVDGDASGETITVDSTISVAGVLELTVFAPGDTVAASVGIAAVGSAHGAPIDGTPIYEFIVSETAALVYQTENYDSIWSRGTRLQSGLVKSSGASGFVVVFAPMSEAFDNNGLSSGGGNGPFVNGGAGSYLWWQYEQDVDIRGVKPIGSEHLNSDDQYKNLWSLFGAYGPGDIASEPYTANFDGFTLTQDALQSGFISDVYASPNEFAPRIYTKYAYYELLYLSDSAINVRVFNELWLKVAHSNLDGGERRPTVATPDRRVVMTLSAHWSTVSGPQPQDAWFDGKYSDTDAGATTAGIGDASVVTTPQSTVGAYIQYAFPRPVIPRYFMFVNFNNGSESYSGGDPTKYGKWHWEYAPASVGPWTSVGDSWFFRENCSWMVAPQVGSFDLTTSDPNGAPYWRMVLDSGPAFGNSLTVSEVLFDLVDVTGQQPPLEIAFSDDTDGVPAVATIGSPGSAYVVTLSDGSDDGISVVVTNIPNPLLMIAFTDEGQLDSWSDLYPSMVVQTTLVTTGR